MELVDQHFFPVLVMLGNFLDKGLVIQFMDLLELPVL
jgi:hypothetical protein